MNDSVRLKFYTSFVHPLLTIFIPFWFFTTLLLVFTNSLILQSGPPVFPPMYFVTMLLVGMSETITGNLLYKERIASILPRLREFVFVLAFSLFFILLFHGEVIRGDFRIGRVKIWLPTVFLGAQWFLSYFIHQRLREREIFLKFFQDKEVKETREIYNNYMHEGSVSLKATTAIKKLVIALMVIGFIGFIITSWFTRIEYKGFALFIIISFFGLFALILALMNIWHEAQFIMMDGHIVPRHQRRFRLIVAILLFAVVLLVIIPFTGSDAIFPESYLQAFFEWLESLGQFKTPVRDIEGPEFSFEQQDLRIDNYLGKAEAKGGESVDLSGLTRVIGWIFLALVIAGVVIFLLLPIFRGAKGGFSPKAGFKKISENIRKSITAFVDSLKQALEELKTRRQVKTWDKIRSRGKSSTSERMEKRAAASAAKRKDKRVLSRILRAFFKFTKWGEKRGISFSFSTGPFEYAQKVAAAVPELGEYCSDIATLFEEVLYSNHEITEKIRSAYLDKVRTVTRAKA